MGDCGIGLFKNVALAFTSICLCPGVVLIDFGFCCDYIIIIIDIQRTIYD